MEDDNAEKKKKPGAIKLAQEQHYTQNLLQVFMAEQEQAGLGVLEMADLGPFSHLLPS